MKPRRTMEISSRLVRIYVKEKLRGFAERQAEREKIRREGRRPSRQERLFE